MEWRPPMAGQVSVACKAAAAGRRAGAAAREGQTVSAAPGARWQCRGDRCALLGASMSVPGDGCSTAPCGSWLLPVHCDAAAPNAGTHLMRLARCWGRLQGARRLGGATCRRELVGAERSVCVCVCVQSQGAIVEDQCACKAARGRNGAPQQAGCCGVSERVAGRRRRRSSNERRGGPQLPLGCPACCLLPLPATHGPWCARDVKPLI